MPAKGRFLALFWGGTAVYVVLVVVGNLVRRQVGSGPGAAMWAIAVATIAVAVGVMAVVITRGRREKELERLLFTEGTSLAFFVTMLAILTYGLLESWVEAPRLSTWAWWSVGMGSWFVLSLVLRRRVS